MIGVIDFSRKKRGTRRICFNFCSKCFQKTANPNIVAFGISKKNLTHVILYLHSPGWVFLICFPEIGKPVYAAYAHAAAKNIANSDRQEVCE